MPRSRFQQPASWIAIAAAVAAAALVLTACGNGEERAIRNVLVSGLTSQDPRTVCEGSLTPALLARIYGDVGSCHRVEGERGEQISQALSVDVAGVHVTEGRATAVVTIHGGNHDGARGAMTLARDGRGWRVTDLSVGLLRSEFEVSLRRSQGVQPGAKACIVAGMRAIDDETFKRLAFDAGTGAHDRLSEVARECQARIAAAERLVR
jgi:hypothetical protein